MVPLALALVLPLTLTLALALPATLLMEARGSVRSSDSSATEASPTTLLDFLDSDSRGSS